MLLHVWVGYVCYRVSVYVLGCWVSEVGDMYVMWVKWRWLRPRETISMCGSSSDTHKIEGNDVESK